MKKQEMENIESEKQLVERELSVLLEMSLRLEDELNNLN